MYSNERNTVILFKIFMKNVMVFHFGLFYKIYDSQLVSMHRNIVNT